MSDLPRSKVDIQKNCFFCVSSISITLSLLRFSWDSIAEASASYLSSLVSIASLICFILDISDSSKTPIIIASQVGWGHKHTQGKKRTAAAQFLLSFFSSHVVNKPLQTCLLVNLLVFSKKFTRFMLGFAKVM